MGRRLRSHVHVRDERNASHVFGPGDEIPDWAAEKITNPKAWAEHPDQDGAEQDTGAGGERAPGGRPAPSATKEVWAAFAAVRAVQIPDGATKADIIAAVDAAER